MQGRLSRNLCSSGLMFLLFAMAAQAIAAEFRPPIYYDVRVPMRDGVELSADVYLPQEEGKYPVILSRTPYNKSRMPQEMPPGWIQARTDDGYILVLQDVRGRGDSDGEFRYFDADVEDGYDTIEWLAKQPWSNGRICMLGVSYLGGVQWQAAQTLPPGLTCIAPVASLGVLNEMPTFGGAFLLRSNLLWTDTVMARVMQWQDIRPPYINDYDALFRHRPLLTMDEAHGRRIQLYRDFLAHPGLDAYWRKTYLDREDFSRIDLPALHITGWFDSNQHGTLHYWNGMTAHSPAADKQYIVVGPWNHSQTIRGGTGREGDMEFSQDAIVDILALHVEFYDHFLKGETPFFDHPRARLYFTGSNEWRDFDAYPPREISYRPLYLDSRGNANTLSGDGTLGWRKPSGREVDEYEFDPQNPVFASQSGEVIGSDYSGADQRPIQAREDVLVYTGDELKQALTIAGPVRARIYAGSDARDTDFTAKITDVYPDGRAVRLGPTVGGIIRARYRDGTDREELIEPGEVYEYLIDIGHIGHTFLPGHRVRLEVSSSFYPVFSPNQNTGNPIATDTEWNIARQSIHHDADYLSAVLLPVIALPAANGAK